MEPAVLATRLGKVFLTHAIPFRRLAIFVLVCLSGLLFAQEPVFRSDSPLVVAHTTVSDANGAYVHSLEPEDFSILVGGKPVDFLLDYSFVPISLVVVVENCGDCAAAIKKLRKVGVMVQPLITGDRGEVALVSYSDEARVRQPFLRGSDGISETFAQLKPSGRGAAFYDALAEAVQLLAPRLRGRRGVILHLGERIDRGSTRSFEEAANLLERNNILLYSVTYSRIKTAFTDKEAWKDQTDDSEFRDKPKDGVVRTPPANAPYGFPAPPPAHSAGDVVMGPGAAPMPGPESGPSRTGSMDLGALFGILADAAKKNAARELAELTGGTEESFTRQGALEQAIARIGEELHSQYLLSFRPVTAEGDRYYRLDVKVKRPGNYTVRTRPGYWLAKAPE